MKPINLMAAVLVTGAISLVVVIGSTFVSFSDDHLSNEAATNNRPKVNVTNDLTLGEFFNNPTNYIGSLTNSVIMPRFPRYIRVYIQTVDDKDKTNNYYIPIEQLD